MSDLKDQQIQQLRKQVKYLKNELCQQTRNYLYHCRKSPVKVIPISKESLSESKMKLHQEQKQTQTYNPNLQIGISSSQKRQAQCNQPVKQDRFSFAREDFAINSPNQPEHHIQSQFNNVYLEPSEQTKQLKFDQQLYSKNQQHIEQINNLTSEIRTIKQKLQKSKSKSPKNSSTNKVQVFHEIQQNQNDNKEDQAKTKGHLQKLHIEENDMNLSTTNELNKKQQKSSPKEVAILQEEVRKLKEHLDYEIKLASYAKQALLMSEQQNYNFRLEIQNLKKQRSQTPLNQPKLASHISNQLSFVPTQGLSKSHSSRSLPSSNQLKNNLNKQSNQGQSTQTQQLERYKIQNEKYQELINHLEKIKDDYLNKCIQLKQEIFKLKEENSTLVREVTEMRALLKKQFQQKDLHAVKIRNQQQTERESAQQYNPDEIKWIELFKSKVHQISNCLPLNNSQQLFVFRPQTVEQVISMLERILQFCRNISLWQRQNIQAIQRQRSNLLRLLSKLLMKHPNTKDTLANQILEIDELKYLVNFLNRQNNHSNKILQLKRKQQLEGQGQQIHDQILKEMRTSMEEGIAQNRK